MTQTPPSMFPDKHYYKAPAEIPAGFFEIIQPMIAWMMRQLVAAYDSGYSAGRLDAAHIAASKHSSRTKIS